MTRLKYGRTMLCICSLILGTLTIGSGVAQALPNWKLEGNNVVATLMPDLKIIQAEGSMKILTTILGKPVKWNCSNIELINFTLGTNGNLVSGGKILYWGCDTQLGSFPPDEACAPSGGFIESKPLKGEIVLHEGKGLLKLEPVTGENFFVIESTVECAIGKSIPIRGKFFLKDCQGEFSVEKAVHLFEQGPLNAMFAISNTPEHAVNVDGSWVLELVGEEHEGLRWSGQPA